jgi:hypothetical protein
MAIGDLVTGNWMIERNGLVIGDGTAYDLRLIKGLSAAPTVRSQDKPLLFRQGSRAGTDRLGDRLFTVEVDIAESTPATMSTLLDAMEEAFRPSDDEIQMVFQAPGLAGGIKSYLNCRIRKRDMPMDLQFLNGLAEVSFQFHATDGRIRSLAESTDNVDLTSNSGGHTFDLTFPMTFGATDTGGQLVVANDGSYPAPVVLRIDGPCVDPEVENTTTGQTLSLNLTILTGSYVELDTDLKMVTLDGSAAAGTGASRYHALDNSSTWFDLDPGNNTLEFRAPTDTGATLTATWSDVWA